MKGSIFQLLIFLLLFVFIILGISVSAYFLWFDAGFSPLHEESGWFWRLFPSFLFFVLPLSILSSILFSHFITLKRKANSFLSLLLVFAAATGIYFFGFSGLSSLTASNSLLERDPDVVLYGGKINPFNNGFVYVGSMDQSNAYDIVRENPSKFPSLSYRDKIRLKVLRSAISSHVKGSDFKRQLAVNPSFSHLFAIPSFLRGFLVHLKQFNGKMNALYRRSLSYFLFSIAAQVFFAVSCWSLLRISRWPLINVFFSLILVRGLFALFSVWDSPVIQEKLAFMGTGIMKENLFSLLLISLGIVLLLFNSLVLLSGKEGKK